MELREKLKSDPEKLKNVEPVKIPQFLLLDKEINIITDEKPMPSSRSYRSDVEASPQLWTVR